MPFGYPFDRCNRSSLKLTLLISFILGMLTVAISTCVILVWAFVPSIAKAHPSGSKVGGVLCTIGTAVICATGVTFYWVQLRWKRSSAASPFTVDECCVLHKDVGVAASNQRHNLTPLQKSYSYAYVPLTAPILDDTGTVQVLRLLGGGYGTLSATELHFSSSSSTAAIRARAVKLAATVSERGILSKVQSEVMVPLVFGKATPLTRNTSFRRSLPKVSLHQTDGSLFMMRNTSIPDESTSLSNGLLPETHCEGLLSSDKLLISRITDIGETKGVVQTTTATDTNDCVVPTSISRALDNQTGPRQPDEQLSLSNPSRQVISCATLFDEQASSDCDEDATLTRLGALNCHKRQPHTAPCTDSTGFFPLLDDKSPAVETSVHQNSNDLAVMLVTEKVNQPNDTEAPDCSSTDFRPNTSLVCRFKNTLRRLLWPGKKATPVCAGRDLNNQSDGRAQVQHVLDADSTSSTSIKPTIVSNASVFSLPAMPPTMWTVDKPVWIMDYGDGLHASTTDTAHQYLGDHLIFLKKPADSNQLVPDRSITGSASSIFAFHVRPPPRLQHARVSRIAQENQQCGRRTRSLGRILLSADRVALPTRSDDNN